MSSTHDADVQVAATRQLVLPDGAQRLQLRLDPVEDREIECASLPLPCDSLRSTIRRHS